MIDCTCEFGWQIDCPSHGTPEYRKEKPDMTENDRYRTLEALFARLAEIEDEDLKTRSFGPPEDEDDDPALPETAWEREIRESDEADEHDDIDVFISPEDDDYTCPDPGDCCVCGTCGCFNEDEDKTDG